MYKYNKNKCDDGKMELPEGRDWFYIRKLTKQVHGASLIEFVCRNPEAVQNMMRTMAQTAFKMKEQTGSCELHVLIAATQSANKVMATITGKDIMKIVGANNEQDFMSLIAEIFEFFVQGSIMSPERDEDGEIISEGTIDFFVTEEEAMHRIDSLFQETIL